MLVLIIVLLIVAIPFLVLAREYMYARNHQLPVLTEQQAREGSKPLSSAFLGKLPPK